MGTKTDDIRDFREYLEVQDHDTLVDLCCDIDDLLVQVAPNDWRPPANEFEARPASDLIELLMDDFEENG